MSDSKRAAIITVGAPKSAKNNVTKTVRLTINLDESNESKYSELNYKELVLAEEKKHKVVNGKTPGLDPFSDNDDDVERVAKKFEQKYGGKSTYGRKGRSKHDDFADIGAGYDENDSFIDNTDGYDEMIPPECDTLYGGFYINSGSLEFKTVPEGQAPLSDAEPDHVRRNKRRISSSSSEEDSSDSSSGSESHDEKDTAPKPTTNGVVDTHKAEHRKKKIKNNEKKAKRIRRADSSAATSGKQTSDDNGHMEGESADSRTSHSDSLTSKPAPSSENVATSDSSRDAGDSKSCWNLPSPVKLAVEDLQNNIARLQLTNASLSNNDLCTKCEGYLLRLDRVLSPCDTRVRKSAWCLASKLLNCSRTKLYQRVKALSTNTTITNSQEKDVTSNANATSNNPAPAPSSLSKHKKSEPTPDQLSALTTEQKEAMIVDILDRLKTVIEEKKPGMMANYKAECERVQEERKKIQIASASDGAPHVEKRMPKRRFPWCSRSRQLLGSLRALAGPAAALVLSTRALPLFPKGFVRMPTLLRQADLKTSDLKSQPSHSTASQPPTQPNPPATNPQPSQTNPQPSQTFTEPILFPASLTVTTTVKTSPDKTETIVVSNDELKEMKKGNDYPAIVNSYPVKSDEKIQERDDKYVPPNSIGSITITPVNNIEKKVEQKLKNNQKEPLIRVKSPAVLIKEANELAKKEKDKQKPKEKPKEKRLDTPLHIDTNFQSKDKITPSPNKSEISHKQVENLRTNEDKIPRPGLIPVHLSPTFAKPDKRPEQKKKKEVLIVSDLDPLGDVQSEPVAIDDSDSDVELIEDSASVKKKNDGVPSSDKVKSKAVLNPLAREMCVEKGQSDVRMEVDDASDIDAVMKNLREMQDSQEPSFNSNSFGAVISNAKHVKPKGKLAEARMDKDKLSNFFKQNGWL